ncbi:MAG: DUF2914 domain-containing protein [Acidiferrobacterales bacterium]
MRFASIAIIATLTAAPLQSALATTADSDPSAAATEVATTTAPSAGWVARATVTSGVQDREPIDSITTLSNDNSKIYYFTEIRDMAGETIMHRWEYNGQVMAEIPFHIGGARWRVYSSKNLEPMWLGDWKVSVVDSSGSPLSVTTFLYTGAVTGSVEQGMSTGESGSQ